MPSKEMKMKMILILLATSLFYINVKGQNVRLGYDTINMITVSEVDTASNQIIYSTKYLFLDNRYYYADNFPFSKNVW
jgi:hypothetical protein